MLWNDLPTNYTDAIWSGLRKYVPVNNEDGTVSFNDVTVYTQRENSFFGAADANAMNTAMNELARNINIILSDNAGAHNAFYRGKNLGTSVTSEQWADIEAGTFTGMYIGDYWVINNITYRIAAFDYYYHTGDTDCTTHHIVMVPDTNLYITKMNETATTAGGYISSKMYTENMSQAKSIINSAFGLTHILSHRQYLCNAVTEGKPSGGSWYDSTVELMTEQNVYGGKIFGAGNNSSSIPELATIDNSQFPLFAHNPFMISNRQYFWLRDVASTAEFAFVAHYNLASHTSAASSSGVRPAFSIC